MSGESSYAGLGPPPQADLFNVSGRVRERVYETRIATCLGPGLAWYSTGLGRLYFWDGGDKPVAATVDAVLSARGISRPPEPFGMDVHGYFRGANRIDLAACEFQSVHMALRLLGVRVTLDTTAVLLDRPAAD